MSLDFFSQDSKLLRNLVFWREDIARVLKKHFHGRRA